MTCPNTNLHLCAFFYRFKTIIRLKLSRSLFPFFDKFPTSSKNSYKSPNGPKRLLKDLKLFDLRLFPAKQIRANPTTLRQNHKEGRPKVYDGQWNRKNSTAWTLAGRRWQPFSRNTFHFSRSACICGSGLHLLFVLG